LLEGWNNFLPGEAQGANAETPYPVAADLLGPLRRVRIMGDIGAKTTCEMRRR
jgi:hypothetical protein